MQLRQKIISQKRRYENNSKIKSIKNKIIQLRNNEKSEKLSTIRKEMNEIWKKLNEINQVHGSSIWPLFFVAAN